MKSDEQRAREFVREQAQGEWGEEIEERDAKALSALLRAVREDERERCAVCAENLWGHTADDIGAAIREQP